MIINILLIIVMIKRGIYEKFLAPANILQIPDAGVQISPGPLFNSPGPLVKNCFAQCIYMET